MHSYSSVEILKILKQDGWVEIHQKGSHLQLKHPTKPGKVTVQLPKKDLDPKTVKSILKQAGISFDQTKGG